MYIFNCIMNVFCDSELMLSIVLHMPYMPVYKQACQRKERDRTAHHHTRLKILRSVTTTHLRYLHNAPCRFFLLTKAYLWFKAMDLNIRKVLLTGVMSGLLYCCSLIYFVIL